jgi:uncharacterized protein (DUF2132 family)
MGDRDAGPGLNDEMRSRPSSAGGVEGHWLADVQPDDLVLYHYTSATTLRSILETRTMRFSPYTKTNDPREYKEWIADVLLAGEDNDPTTPADADSARRQADILLRRGARLACFTVDRSAVAESSTGMLFHKGWARANMWAQYAQQHSGACLAFDRALLVEQADVHRPAGNGDLFSFGRVVYADAPIHIPLSMEDVRANGIESVLDDYQTWRGVASGLYFTKNTDWASEQEFRIVIVRWNLPEDQWDVPLGIPLGESLRAVVIGEAFAASDVQPLRRWLEKWPEVDLIRCVWDRGAPSLAPV